MPGSGLPGYSHQATGHHGSIHGSAHAGGCLGCGCLHPSLTPHSESQGHSVLGTRLHPGGTAGEGSLRTEFGRQVSLKPG